MKKSISFILVLFFLQICLPSNKETDDQIQIFYLQYCHKKKTISLRQTKLLEGVMTDIYQEEGKSNFFRELLRLNFETIIQDQAWLIFKRNFQIDHKKNISKIKRKKIKRKKIYLKKTSSIGIEKNTIPICLSEDDFF